MNIKEMLEEILKIADDQTYSHVSRMIQIKGLATDALREHSKEKGGGAKAGNQVQKPDPAMARQAASKLVDQSPANGPGGDT